MKEQEIIRETVAERLEKKQSHGKVCNICSHPSYVSYQEKDEETGKIVTKSHLVECIGHQSVPFYLHNLHKDYDDFQRWAVRHKKETEGSRKE